MDFFEINEQYHEGILLNEYQGKYSLVTASKGEDDKTYMQWVHPSGGRGEPPSDKVIPQGSPRMSRDQIVKLANDILRHFGG